MEKFKGKTVLITGASSGIGKACAETLAQQGCNLIIVARRRNRLAELRLTLEKKHGVEITIIAEDISSMEGCHSLIETVERKSLAVDYLINNAGVGYEGDFIHQNWEKVHQMMRLNMDTLTFLSRHFGEKLPDANRVAFFLSHLLADSFPAPEWVFMMQQRHMYSSLVKHWPVNLNKKMSVSPFYARVQPELSFLMFQVRMLISC